MEHYYLHISPEDLGPFTWENVEAQARSGSVPREALYWIPGMNEWRSVEELLVEKGIDLTSIVFPDGTSGATFPSAPANDEPSSETAGHVGSRPRWFRSRRRWIWAAVGLALFVTAGIAMSWGTKLPPHVFRQNDGTPTPEAGYKWLTGKPRDYRVVWAPGVEHFQQPHVFAGIREGSWNTGAGYSWVSTNNTDLRVTWSRGLAHPDRAHVLAGEGEGTWVTEAGYRFQEPFTNMHAQWSPGTPHPSRPHVVAHRDEGFWTPEAGYTFRGPKGSLETQWSPGSTHPSMPHVLAAAKEGVWRPEVGYQWVDEKAANDFRVVAIPSRRNAPGEWTAGQKAAAVGLGLAAGWALTKLLGGDDSPSAPSTGGLGEFLFGGTRTCLRCDGEGTLSGNVEVATTSGMREVFRTVTCPVCNGTGQR